MSDNKALYNIVADALAGRGDEAQQAWESLMGRLNDAGEARDHAVDMLRSAWHTLDALSSLHEIGDHAYQELACYLSDEPMGEDGDRIVTRAEADNAVLLSLVRQAIYGNGKGGCTECGRNGGCEEGCEMAREAAAHHPGAALLEEVEGLRAENERLRQERNHWEGRAALTASEVAQTIVREPISIQVEGIPETMRAIIERDAHNAALEEAAKVVQKFRAEWTRVSEQFRTDEYKAKWALSADIIQDVEAELRALKKTGQGE